MNCLVTGASGFIGANLVHELVKAGHAVKALVRPGSDLRGLEGVEVERLLGDVTRPETLRPALRGCDWCFHLAATYRLWLRDYQPMYEVNVKGTRNVIDAAAGAGCQRIIYTSTVGCIGLPEQTNGRLHPSDESTPLDRAQLNNHYKLSKYQAEQAATELAAKGLPIVIVNPSAPIGPRDVKPTPTGQWIVDFINRQLPAYVDTGLNFVHVRDVAIGHIRAAERGRIGERYILGNTEGNWTMERSLQVLQEITGVRAPRMKVPFVVALAAAHLDELRSRFSGRAPKAPLAGVRMAKHKMFYNPAKAIRELDLPQTPPRQALLEAVNWFRSGGYVGRGE